MLINISIWQHEHDINQVRFADNVAISELRQKRNYWIALFTLPCEDFVTSLSIKKPFNAIKRCKLFFNILLVL